MCALCLAAMCQHWGETCGKCNGIYWSMSTPSGKIGHCHLARWWRYELWIQHILSFFLKLNSFFFQCAAWSSCHNHQLVEPIWMSWCCNYPNFRYSPANYLRNMQSHISSAVEWSNPIVKGTWQFPLSRGILTQFGVHNFWQYLFSFFQEIKNWIVDWDDITPSVPSVSVNWKHKQSVSFF